MLTEAVFARLSDLGTTGAGDEQTERLIRIASLARLHELLYKQRLRWRAPHGIREPQAEFALFIPIYEDDDV
jgi:hypothetical protein